jgi:hypothetical protein
LTSILLNHLFATKLIIQGNFASLWWTLNEKERGMTIGIVALGLLCLFLAGMYIWVHVTHRFHVTTNDRRGETKYVNESSTV